MFCLTRRTSDVIMNIYKNDAISTLSEVLSKTRVLSMTKVLFVTTEAARLIHTQSGSNHFERYYKLDDN